MLTREKAMRAVKSSLYSLIHALGWAAIWAISFTSCAHVIRPPEAAASALAPVLKTKIFVQNDERPGFEYAAFDVPAAGEAILRVVNAAKVGASPRQRIQGAKITLNGHVFVKPSPESPNDGMRRNGWQ